MRRLLLRALAALACGLAGVLLVLAYFAFTLPVSRHLTVEPTQASLLLEGADGEIYASRGTIRGRPPALRTLPPDLVQAVLAAEDRRFYGHIGIDPRGVARALLANLRAGEIREGASTITQQLAKVMFLSPERTFKRKIQEVMVALWLERRLTKDEILARYLGTVYFGAGAYGVEGAAQRYFDKPVQALSLSEAAMLAGLIKAPSVLAPTRSLETARARADTVLNAMVETGYLDPGRAAEAHANPARLIAVPDFGSERNYFADWVVGQARRRLGPVEANLTVRTTLDLALQDLAGRVIAERLARHGAALDVGQAALVAMAPDGAVLAMVGGRAYGESQFNRVTQARRQPGSLFKLFVYLASFEAGFGPDSVLSDKAVQIGTWQPRNYDGRYRGDVTLRTAFAQSINTVAVQLAEKAGHEEVIGVARDLGVRAPLKAAPSLALGTSETTLLEMTAAYATLAAGQGLVEPYGIRSVKERTAGVAWQPMKPGKPAARDWKRREMLDLLTTVVRSGTGKAAALGRPAAGKTGTTQDHRDAWFIGFTADLVVGVWVGNDDNAPMKAVTGGGLPAQIWRDFLAGAEQLERGQARNGAALIVELLPGREGAQAAARPRAKQAGRSDVAAKPKAATPAEVSPPQAPIPPRVLKGVPRIIDTGALEFGRRVARLVGVKGAKGEFVRQMRQYIGDRTVTCWPFDDRSYRCEVGGYDLSEVVLFNGGGRSTRRAPDELKAAEESARSRNLGIWGGEP